MVTRVISELKSVSRLKLLTFFPEGGPIPGDSIYKTLDKDFPNVLFAFLSFLLYLSVYGCIIATFPPNLAQTMQIPLHCFWASSRGTDIRTNNWPTTRKSLIMQHKRMQFCCIPMNHKCASC